MYLIGMGMLFVAGGLSGTMALRGTGSSIGLAVVGACMVIWGIVSLSSSSSAAPPRPRRSSKGVPSKGSPNSNGPSRFKKRGPGK